jgi:cellulose synthase/poly-beta-1,6-N-acetylglucosamine synthase-like glycosyltransferase
LSFITTLLIGASVVVSVPLLVLVLEVIAAVLARHPQPHLKNHSRALDHDSLAVVIPAHNETTGIIPTIEDITPQLRPGDRLIVIADNCSDDTAAVAASLGADVVERNDLSRRGKGFALACAIQHLSAKPPDFVLFIDADCRIEHDATARLINACRERGRPVQAGFLMREAKDSAVNNGLAEFAFLVRSWVRPLGLAALEFPSQLMGTGMIFPWKLICSAPLANDHLVEDLKLGLDLAASGHAPSFFPETIVTSEFPASSNGTDLQRERWTQGQLNVIATAPALLMTSIRRRNIGLLVLTLDTLVPPLFLLALLMIVLLLLSACVAMLGGSNVPLIISVADLALLGMALSASWYQFGRRTIPLRKMFDVAGIVARARLLTRIATGRTSKQWLRAKRGSDELSE